MNKRLQRCIKPHLPSHLHIKFSNSLKDSTILPDPHYPQKKKKKFAPRLPLSWRENSSVIEMPHCSMKNQKKCSKGNKQTGNPIKYGQDPLLADERTLLDSKWEKPIKEVKGYCGFLGKKVAGRSSKGEPTLSKWISIFLDLVIYVSHYSLVFLWLTFRIKNWDYCKLLTDWLFHRCYVCVRLDIALFYIAGKRWGRRFSTDIRLTTEGIKQRKIVTEYNLLWTLPWKTCQAENSTFLWTFTFQKRGKHWSSWVG